MFITIDGIVANVVSFTALLVKYPTVDLKIDKKKKNFKSKKTKNAYNLPTDCADAAARLARGAEV